MMLKHLDKWLDSLNEFESKHGDFCTVAKIIAWMVAIVGLILAFGTGAVVINHWADTINSGVIWEGDLRLSDSRIVHCIATGNGMSCDWTHVSGADNL